MKSLIGIRRETKNEWEKRAPLTPQDIKRLRQEQNLEFVIQPSAIRIFSDEEYREAGATIAEDLSSCPTVLAIKEIPERLLQEEKTYIFFSHTVKGQKQNMAMLKRMMELKCNLIDYEKITDEAGRRLIFFGRYAGLAGMIQVLWALGKRVQWEGFANPFEAIAHTYTYKDLQTAKTAISQVGEKIKTQGIPAEIAPLIVGFAGYGNVSAGAQEILGLLPVIQTPPAQLKEVFATKKDDVNHIYKVVFSEEDMVEPVSAAGEFELQDYYRHPEKYCSRMEQYLPYLTVLLNCIYWTPKYSRILTKEFAKTLFSGKTASALKIIGDITCDREGAIECTTQMTQPDKPVFVYHPATDESILGYEGPGMVIMAEDNLPCELARESSESFGHVLREYIPEIVAADYSQSFETCNLPEVIKKAMILYHGELSPNYKYLEEYLKN